MKLPFFTLLLFLTTLPSKAQTVTERFFKDEYLSKEVSKENAKFAQIVTHNIDSTVKTDIVNIKKGQVIRSETYKGGEPFGIWFNLNGKDSTILDYNFNLIYSAEECKDTLPLSKLNNYFEDVDSVKYIAPKFVGGQNGIFKFISERLRYPHPAIENGIQGKVTITFTVSENGVVESTKIFKGANILLDKEAARIIRQMNFINPATINGVKYRICFKLPISFKLT